MKLILHISLILAYLLPNVGMTVFEQLGFEASISSFEGSQESICSCCDGNSEDSCCQKDKKESNNKTNKGSKCGSDSCHCLGMNLSLNSLLNHQSKSEITPLVQSRNTFFFIESNTSSGFDFIWLRPKIG